MTILLIIGAGVLAVIAMGLVLVISQRLTERKSNEELAQRLSDGSAINHDTSGGMWSGGGGD